MRKFLLKMSQDWISADIYVAFDFHESECLNSHSCTHITLGVYTLSREAVFSWNRILVTESVASLRTCRCVYGAHYPSGHTPCASSVMQWCRVLPNKDVQGDKSVNWIWALRSLASRLKTEEFCLPQVLCSLGIFLA